MLMLNKAAGNDANLERSLYELLQYTKNMGKFYNVESDGAQTILALLPDRPNRPFVYKGENSLLKNLSTYGGLLDPNLLSSSNGDQILKLDISKPDSEVLHAIFNKMKDELHGTEKLIPYEIDGVNYHHDDISMQQQARRIPQSGRPSSATDRYNDV
ncbi:hypothetical protein BLA29_012150, partial [Euroglyphus maynei]